MAARSQHLCLRPASTCVIRTLSPRRNRLGADLIGPRQRGNLISSCAHTATAVLQPLASTSRRPFSSKRTVFLDLEVPKVLVSEIPQRKRETSQIEGLEMREQRISERLEQVGLPQIERVKLELERALVQKALAEASNDAAKLEEIELKILELEFEVKKLGLESALAEAEKGLAGTSASLKSRYEKRVLELMDEQSKLKSSLVFQVEAKKAELSAKHARQRMGGLGGPVRSLPSLDEACREIIGKVKTWPSLDAFEPKPFVPMDKKGLTSSKALLESGVLRSFKYPEEPDLLMTDLVKLRELRDFSLHDCSFPPGSKDYVLDGQVTDIASALKDRSTLVLLGASGSGKTALTLRRAIDEWTVLLVCDTKGNGGSTDVASVLYKAERMARGGGSPNQVEDYVCNQLKKIIRFRQLLLEECRKQYRDAFTTRHWIFMQLYGNFILGPDFSLHAIVSTETQEPNRPNVEGYFAEIVLDEAQVADRMLEKTFPSSSDPKIKRSLLAPFARELNMYSVRVTICGTGLSAASVVETAVSSIKSKVPSSILAVSTFLEPEQVREALKKWGVTDLPKDADVWCKLFQGRPRQAAYLAQTLLEDGRDGVQKQKEAVIKYYAKAVQKWANVSPRSTTQGASDGVSVRFLLHRAATDFVLGYAGEVKTDFQAALQHGLCALREAEAPIGSTSSSSSAGKSGTLCKPVVAEPLLLLALSTNIVETYEERIRMCNSHNGVAEFVEDYMALRCQDLCVVVKRAADLLAKDPGVESFKKSYMVHTREEEGGRIVYSRCRKPGEEHERLKEMLEQERCGVIMPSTSMGPDLIVVARCGTDSVLVILVQVKSGKRGPFPEALLRLQQLYVQNRGKDAKTHPLGESFEKLLQEKKCAVSLMVVKPLGGSGFKKKVSLDEKGRLEVILDAHIFETLYPDHSRRVIDSLKKLKSE